MVGVARDERATPAFCFARTGSCEIELHGKKLVGSAQRRYGRTFLQHGSVLLGVDAPRLGAIFPTTPDPLATLTTLEAVAREVAEECGLAIRVAGVAGIVERVVRDEAGRIRYHYVLVDYLAFPESTRLVPGSDAADAQWIEIDRVAELDTTEGLLDMVRRAQALERGDRA